MPIVNMRSSDIDSALLLINAEGWGYAREELERMLKLDPQGSFMYLDKEPKGVVTTVTYGRTGVIGHLVVSAQARGKKIGQALMNRAMEYFDEMGIESVLVYSTDDGQKIYPKFGFKEVQKSLCTKKIFALKELGSGFGPCMPVGASDLDQICALDAKYFGDDRGKILRLLYSEFPQHCWKLERDQRIVGFSMGRGVSSGSFDFGPLECVSGEPEDVRALFSATLRSFGGGKVYMGAFHRNKMAVDLLSTLKSETEWTTTLMVRGSPRYTAGIDSMFIVSAYELG